MQTFSLHNIYSHLKSGSNYMVTETYRYVHNMKFQANSLPRVHIKNWYDTTYSEIKIFLSTILWMEVVRLS